MDVTFKIQREGLSETYLERILHGKGLRGARVSWGGLQEIRIENVPLGTSTQLLTKAISQAETQRLKWCIKWRKELGVIY